MNNNFLVLLIVTIFVLGCKERDGEILPSSLTDADAFVVSEQFQEYQTMIYQDHLEFDSIYKGLTKEQKDSLIKCVAHFKLSNNGMVREKCINQINGILGIDILERIEKHVEMKANVFRNVNISKKELLLAIQRYNLRRQETRSNDNEYLYGQCREYCEKMRQVAVSSCDCDEWFSSNPIVSNSECIACHMDAEIQWEQCKADCEYRYN